jgi:transposase-like protein
MISKKYGERCYAHYLKHGERKAAEILNIKESTLRRHIRNYKKLITGPKSGAKILLVDTENTPILTWLWHLGKQSYVGPEFVERDWNEVCWSAKWLYDSKVMSGVQTPEEAILGDDKRIMKELLNLMNKADIIIGHNINNFDEKKINTRLILNKLSPPSPYQTIDTLTVAKKHFKFSSNKLDYLGKMLLNKEKIRTNFSLWRRCIAGDLKALRFMSKYCNRDVNLLEGVYIEERPWIKSHPNVAIYDDCVDSMCPACGSKDLSFNGDYYITMVSKFESLKCNVCGSYSRRRKNVMDKDKREGLLRSNAR